MDEVPVYEFSGNYFATYLKLNAETGLKYLRLRVLIPDAKTANGRPLFKVDSASIERHKAAIRAYRVRAIAVRQNVVVNSV